MIAWNIELLCQLNGITDCGNYILLLISLLFSVFWLYGQHVPHFSIPDYSCYIHLFPISQKFCVFVCQIKNYVSLSWISGCILTSELSETIWRLM